MAARWRSASKCYIDTPGLELIARMHASGAALPEEIVAFSQPVVDHGIVQALLNGGL